MPACVGQLPVLREPRVQFSFAGISGPTSFPGQLPSLRESRTNFLPERLPRLSRQQVWGMIGDLVLTASLAVHAAMFCARDVILERVLSRGMFRERLQVGPSRARLFLMTMLVISSRLSLMTARSSKRQLHFTGMMYGYGELISCLGSRIRLPPYLGKLAGT